MPHDTGGRVLGEHGSLRGVTSSVRRMATLSEADSKRLLAAHGVPVVEERLALSVDEAVRHAATELLGMATPDDGEVGVLVSRMLSGTRELIAGLARDPQFGMTVMLGVGGILAEAVADVTFRLVPVDAVDADEMVDDLATQRLLGPFRGEPAIDRAAVVAVLTALSAAALEHPAMQSADLNPLLIVDGRPIAVDALVEVA